EAKAWLQQTPPSQLPKQHWELLVQASPSATQQKPCMQIYGQQAPEQRISPHGQALHWLSQQYCWPLGQQVPSQQVVSQQVKSMPGAAHTPWICPPHARQASMHRCLAPWLVFFTVLHKWAQSLLPWPH